MYSLIFNKLINGIATLFGVATLVFFLFTILPGDPAQMMLDQRADSDQLKVLRAKYGFDLPKFKQYVYYINDLSIISIHSSEKEDFNFYNKKIYGGLKIINYNNFLIVIKLPFLRTSYQRKGKKVLSIIAETLPNTIILALSSISIAIFFGVLFGIISGYYKDHFIDKFLQLYSTLGMSLPSFFSAILFSWFFGFVLHDYTNLNTNGSLYELDDYGENYNLHLKNLILPSIVLGIRPIAIIIQLMRSELIDVLSQEYIKTAKAKGLTIFNIIFFHAIKNSLNPVITAISGWFASLLAGAVFVEYIFGWRGLGKEIVDSLNSLDIPVVMGSVLVISFLFILINIIVDILYSYLDPKVKLK
ncbi:MAG: ABC transporter permease [Flavobacteriaceae bacterium]|nr:ABC transporter permease [Flavobacteriaceae bacterium]